MGDFLYGLALIAAVLFYGSLAASITVLPMIANYHRCQTIFICPDLSEQRP